MTPHRLVATHDRLLEAPMTEALAPMRDPRPTEGPVGRPLRRHAADRRIRAGSAGRGVRPDIQGMRALAVLLVIAYHVRPSAVSGGFVGVDVFFVISGYLIVGSLTREAVLSGRVSLAAFYAKRVRRLLPASTLVIISTLVVGLFVLPATQWRGLGWDAIASALQIQNWVLAFGPNEYAQATAAASPYQHFWSLAVEEQFYAVIPVLILVTAILALRRRIPTSIAVTSLTLAAFVISLAWSMIYSGTDSQAAYFATTTRVWELALGGLLAVAASSLRLPRGVATLLGFAGLAAILLAAMTFTTDMAFPGWIALVPTLGTAALLLAGQSGHSSPVGSVLSWRPATYVGDISYSLYLWHWPVIVFTLAISGRDALTWQAALVVIALSLVLAAISTQFVEAPFRRHRARSTGEPSSDAAAVRRSRRRTFIAGGSAIALCVAVAVGPIVYIDQRLSASVTPTVMGNPGAMAFRGVVPAAGARLLPDPLRAHEDVSLANRDSCITLDITLPETAADVCRYGPSAAPRSIVLVGDSHAAVFSTPLQELAEKAGVRLTVLVRNGCPFNVTPMVGGFEECAAQNERSLQLILREHPDVVVVTSMTPRGYQSALGWGWSSDSAAEDGFRATLEPISAAGIPIVAVRDTPFPPFVAPDCVERNGDSDSCSFPRGAPALDEDPIVTVASTLPGATVVDLTDAICRSDVCRSVEGNVLVYRDNHLTDTYARSLSSWLAPALGL